MIPCLHPDCVDDDTFPCPRCGGNFCVNHSYVDFEDHHVENHWCDPFEEEDYSSEPWEQELEQKGYVRSETMSDWDWERENNNE